MRQTEPDPDLTTVNYEPAPLQHYFNPKYTTMKKRHARERTKKKGRIKMQSVRRFPALTITDVDLDVSISGVVVDEEQALPKLDLVPGDSTAERFAGLFIKSGC